MNSNSRTAAVIALATSLPHVKTGRLTLLAAGRPKRSPLIPDTPPLSETYPGFEVVTWYGIAAPARTSREILHKLNAGIVRGVASPDLAERYAAMGLEPRSSTPQEMLDYTRSEIAKWGSVVKADGVKGE